MNNTFSILDEKDREIIVSHLKDMQITIPKILERLELENDTLALLYIIELGTEGDAITKIIRHTMETKISPKVKEIIEREGL